MPKRKPRTFGYLRVSTADQDNDKFQADVLKFANDHDFGKVDFIDEKVTGLKSWKDRKIGKLVKEMKKGDRLIVPELSRLARSTLQILEICTELRKKGVSVYAIKGGWSLNDTIESKVLLMCFAMIAEIERDLISMRVKEGLAAAKAKGRQLGRPKGPGKSKLDKFRPEIEALLKSGSPKTYIAKRYGTTTANFHNWLKKNKIDVKPEYPTIKSR